MTYGLLSACALIAVVADLAIARGEPAQSDRPPQGNAVEASGMTVPRGGSWEGWLNHGARAFMPGVPVPPRSPEHGASTAPLSPSRGPGSGLLGFEAGPSPSRLRSNPETEYRGAGIDAPR